MQRSLRYDVIIVGAGHAGCEAARACARMGLQTAMVTMNIDLIAQMSCNPAIGGIAKGHLVREVDALGGVMGELTDAVGIQFRPEGSNQKATLLADWTDTIKMIVMFCDLQQPLTRHRFTAQHVFQKRNDVFALFRATEGQDQDCVVVSCW